MAMARASAASSGFGTVALLGTGTQDHAPGLGHLDAGGDVVVEKQFLDGHRIRLDLVQQGQGVLVDLGQPQVEGGMGLGGDGAAADQPVFHAVMLDGAVAYDGIARVDAQHDHSPLPFPFHR